MANNNVITQLEEARKLDEYAANHSTNLVSLLHTHYQWTLENYADADRSSSLLQVSTDAN
jgi:hypothetical protein